MTVYVIDSGLRTTHIEFDGKNASCGFDAFVDVEGNDGNFSATIERCIDDANHGTHVAGIVGGFISGVAKNARMVSVTVFDKNGRTSLGRFLAGMDYVVGQKKLNPEIPVVINISFGGKRLESVNRVMDLAVEAGIVIVAAAGNSGLNACLASPASAESVITVGSSSISPIFKRDRRLFNSNHGRCVDLFA